LQKKSIFPKFSKNFSLPDELFYDTILLQAKDGRLLRRHGRFLPSLLFDNAVRSGRLLRGEFLKKEERDDKEKN
jgi:hypothetical protein